ncbi:hypothetical protein B6U91_00065 [Candidatus Pacearchaeota archaeon ex4484_71]|nr:MAG: hypothetical protein B6U91_00065 [Candidatus Pacearchaeota archaeon ex4484_71]
MISKSKSREIRDLLEDSQNPLFFFDNDQDGLCSYLILRRFLGRGRGVPVKTNPLTKEYIKRVREFSPDRVFVLDVPEISNDFLEELFESNIPLVHIDHHKVQRSKYYNKISYYNSSSRSGDGEPVTVICYNVAEKREDIWLGVIGAISDKYFPPFYKVFLSLYPDLALESNNPFEILYNSGIGDIARMLGAGLKDRTTNVMKMIRFLINSRGPYDLANDNKEDFVFYKRFKDLEKKMDLLIRKAKKNLDEEKLLFFKYSGEVSMSADISNKLSYLYPKKYVVVAYAKGNFVNISARGEQIKKKIMPLLKKIKDSKGGGHENAVGAQLPLASLDFFVEELKKSI